MNETNTDGAVPGLARLRRDQAPERDLWPGIEQRIAPRRRRRAAPVWLAAAASVLVVVGLFAPRPGSEPLPVSTGAPPTIVAVARDRLPGPERALLKANLQIADHAERDLIAAIDRQPDSPELQRLLQTTRQRQQHIQALL